MPQTDDVETRLELVRALQMLSVGNQYTRRWQPGGKRSRAGNPPPPKVGRKGREERMQYLQQAVEMMQQLLQDAPESEVVQMRRVELLSQTRKRDWQKLLLGDAANHLQVLDELLQKYPENHLFKRAYVQWSMHPHRSGEVAALDRAARYARSLLADNPGSSEMMMLYIAVRDRLSSAIAEAGDPARAARENEMTLGVISLVTSRSDYTPEMRERLALLVSMHGRSRNRTQQEAEISLLLESMDEKRMQEVRRRINSMRDRRFHRGAPFHFKRREPH